MKTKARVLVMGATGQVGGALVPLLAADQRVTVGDDDTRVAHYGWHQFIERYIEWSGITFTHLRPEIFMQNLLGYGGESYVEQGVITHYVGGARLSWVDCDDVAAVAAVCLAQPEQHAGKTYRMGYEAKSYYELADVFTEVLGQPFSYEPQPPSDFLRNVLAAGAEPAYMKCVFDSYTDLTNGKDIGADKTFDNFPQLTGRAPRNLADFARIYADRAVNIVGGASASAVAASP
jgi:NAD(P)H dehydrogenase (quinone)